MEPTVAYLVIAALAAPFLAGLLGFLARGPAVDEQRSRADRAERDRDVARAGVRAMVVRELARAEGIERDLHAHRDVDLALAGDGPDAGDVDAAVERVLSAMRGRSQAAAGARPAASVETGDPGRDRYLGSFGAPGAAAGPG